MGEGAALPVVGTDLYRWMMAWADEDPIANHRELMVKVWSGTPWMVDAFTGSVADTRDFEMRDWCYEHFGEQAWPIHGKPGDWHRGSATVFGRTWFGFATEEMLNQFAERWPDPAN